MIKLIPNKRVNKTKYIKRMITWLNQNFYIPDDFKIRVRHYRYFDYCGKYFLGIFIYNKKKKEIPTIYVATWRPLKAVYLTILHEFVHYEQYRDNKNINHRGLENRVHHLYRCYREQTRL